MYLRIIIMSLFYYAKFFKDCTVRRIKYAIICMYKSLEECEHSRNFLVKARIAVNCRMQLEMFNETV